MKQRSWVRVWVAGCFVVAVTGCATTPPPYVGQGPHPQMTRGGSVPPIDFLGNVLALPWKLILWNWQFDNHAISEATEQKLIAYVGSRDLPAFKATTYRLNQYAPFADLGALVHNHYAAWPYRLLLGFPTTLVIDVLLPGRLFPWGDYFNPYTNVAHLYSDDPTIALHEAGHAYDFARRRYKGTYAAVRIIPFVDLYQEWQATGEAVRYLKATNDRDTELRAYKTLWPAYGTYVGGYIFAPIGTLGGVILGHIGGRSKAATQKAEYEKSDTLLSGALEEPPPSTPSPAISDSVPQPAAPVSAGAP